MTPLGHFLVAVLPVAAIHLLLSRTPPSRRLVFVAFVGSQFPDLIDKPLAHQFFLIPSGRLVAHSLVVSIPLALVLLYALRDTHLREASVFVFAHLSHIVADFSDSLLQPTPELHPNLLWPLVAPIPGAPVPNWAGPGSLNVTLWTVFSVSLLALTAYLVWRERRLLTSRSVRG